MLNIQDYHYIKYKPILQFIIYSLIQRTSPKKRNTYSMLIKASQCIKYKQYKSLIQNLSKRILYKYSIDDTSGKNGQSFIPGLYSSIASDNIIKQGIKISREHNRQRKIQRYAHLNINSNKNMYIPIIKSNEIKANKIIELMQMNINNLMLIIKTNKNQKHEANQDRKITKGVNISEKNRQIFIENMFNIMNSEEFKKYIATKNEQQQIFDQIKHKNNTNRRIIKKMGQEEKQEKEFDINRERFQLFCLISNKMKGEGLKMYRVQGYKEICTLIQKLYEKLKIDQKYFHQLVNKTHQNIQQELKSIDQEKGKSDNAKQNNQKQKQKTRQQLIEELASKASLISLPQLSLLLENVQKIPSWFHPILLSLFLAHIDSLNFFSITTFMLDCVINNRYLSHEYLQRLHKKLMTRQFLNCHRYAFLVFFDHYIENYTCSYNVMNFGRKTFSPYFLSNFQNTYNYTKLLAMEYKVSSKTLTRSLFIKFPYYLVQIHSHIIDKRYNFYATIKLYNIIAQIYPLGILFIRQLLLPKDFKIDNENIDEIKQFISNVMKNLKTQYIYSIDEKPVNEINQQILNIVKQLIKHVITIDQQFLIQTTELFQNHLDYSGQFTRNFMMCINELVEKFDIAGFVERYINNNNSQASENVVYKQKIMKFINFVYTNENYVEKSQIQPFINNLYNQFMELKSFENTNKADWKFLYEILSLLKKIEISQQENGETDQEVTRSSNKILNFYQKFCEPYIAKNQQNLQTNVIRVPRCYQQYILRIAYLVGPQYFSSNPEKAKQLTNYINNNFIYTAKSVLKTGIFDIIILFDWLSDIDPQIHAYLYSNLSSFILYVQKIKKYYLRRGRNNEYDAMFLAMLEKATKNYNVLKNIKNKDRLNTLKILAIIFWRRLTNQQIAQLLIIIGNPTLIGNQIRILLQKKVTFTPEDIKGLDLQTLSSFKLRNKDLLKALRKVVPHLAQIDEKMDMKLSNLKTQEEIKHIFQYNEFYEEAIEIKAFTNEHLIPEPRTADPKVKMIYACLKIVEKIRREKDFSIEGTIKLAEELNKNREDEEYHKILRNYRKQINLDSQNDYISQHNLIKLNTLNEFKLDNIEIKGHYQMIEGWNILDRYDNLIEIEEYSPFGDDSSPYQSALLAINGNYGLIKQLVKKQAFNPNVIKQILAYQLQYYSRGSLIEISFNEEAQEEFYIFCTNQTNFKLHTIYAYIMSQIGYRVCLVDQKVTEKRIQQLLLAVYGEELLNRKRREQSATQAEEVAEVAEVNQSKVFASENVGNNI